MRPATPGRQRLPLTRARVWAGALSLAATRAISVDFSSSGYLDVSVPPVVPPPLCVQGGVAGHGPCWVPPFGDPRIEGRVRLPGDYRGLPRPSSTSCAKASAVRPRYLLLPSRSLRKSLDLQDQDFQSDLIFMLCFEHTFAIVDDQSIVSMMRTPLIYSH